MKTLIQALILYLQKKINGLITKYGGINSHMAIRCAELNLPAAIGVGNDLFNQIIQTNKLLLDCESKKIIVNGENNYKNKK